MTAKIIDGKLVAEELRSEVLQASQAHEAKTGRKPLLVALQVGDSQSSKLYTDMQAKQAQAVGIDYDLRVLDENSTEADVLKAIEDINSDDNITGVILQMPLPAEIDAHKMQLAISPEKDIEGIHPQNLGRLFFGKPAIAPCTPLAVVELLNRNYENMNGKQCVIVGRSEIVGKPIAMLLLGQKRNCPTITICNSRTVDLESHIRDADIVISATGAPQLNWLWYKKQLAQGNTSELPDLSAFIKGDWIKPGAVVIDVATNRVPIGFDDEGQPIKNEKGKIAMRTVGDIEFDVAKEKASAITPVPGGVGPVTVAMLMRNVIANLK